MNITAIKGLLAKIFQKKASSTPLQQTTDELIEETLAELRKEYKKVMAEIKKREEPLTEDEAELLLNIFVKLAVEKKALLISRLGESFETGAMKDHAFSAIDNIMQLTNQATAEKIRVQRLKDRYLRVQSVYEKIAPKEYVASVAPAQSPPKTDIWEKINNE